MCIDGGVKLVANVICLFAIFVVYCRLVGDWRAASFRDFVWKYA